MVNLAKLQELLLVQPYKETQTLLELVLFLRSLDYQPEVAELSDFIEQHPGIGNATVAHVAQYCLGLTPLVYPKITPYPTRKKITPAKLSSPG